MHSTNARPLGLNRGMQCTRLRFAELGPVVKSATTTPSGDRNQPPSVSTEFANAQLGHASWHVKGDAKCPRTGMSNIERPRSPQVYMRTLVAPLMNRAIDAPSAAIDVQP